MKLKTEHVVLAIGLGLAGLAAYAATRGTGPVQMTKFTELRAGPLMEHLVTTEELIVPPVFTGIRYPQRIGPQVTSVITQGYTPRYQIPDPQIAALPAEQAW